MLRLSSLVAIFAVHLLLCGLLCGVAHAQQVSYASLDGAELRCVSDSTETCVSNADCTLMGETCVRFPGQGMCADAERLFCRDETRGGCPIGRELRPIGMTGISLCMPSGRRWCAESGPGFTSCFREPGAPSDALLVDFELGDCDRDGIPNGAETDAGLCVPVERFGVVGPSGNCDTLASCRSDGDCPSEAPRCEGVGAHYFCVPDVIHHCCGGFVGVECPDGTACEPTNGTADGNDFCADPGYCVDLEFTDRTACLFFGGERVEDPDAGDCDEDGIANASDESPCEFDAPPDAGTSPPQDGGGTPPPEDAASPPMDAGHTTPPPPPEDRQPQFAGGGGCLCRATGAPGGQTPWLAALALGVLGLLWRQRP